MSELASPAKSAEGGGGGGDGADAELPKAMLKRILVARLQEWDAANGGDGTRSFQISKVRWLVCTGAVENKHSLAFGCLASLAAAPPATRFDHPPPATGTRPMPQDALLACSEAGKLFIHYLTATAGDNCRDAKRQTVSAGAARGLAAAGPGCRRCRCRCRLGSSRLPARELAAAVPHCCR